ncbi:hypothetical protein JOQ06_005141 [Pogonophryne albipinna]|uniref:Uncharacterized protein n=1 Tax=Pogonophryne albipinna TaxID=1090488 RepID=A0AAD6F4U8_9TELE|nr:hypothetical protein JOQ06_005141 [Pogonophryne albipinna]
MVRWNTYTTNALQSAFEVSDVQGKAMSEQEIQRNREILTRLIDITLYLARQGKAFRGDGESATSSNQGNFLELVQMCSQYDSVLRLHLDDVNDQTMGTAAGDAKMFLKTIDFECFLCLEIAITPVFEVTALASDALQNCDIDLSTAYSFVDGVMDTLSNLRTEEQFGKQFKSATEKAEAAGISIPTVPPSAKAEEGACKVSAKY